MVRLNENGQLVCVKNGELVWTKDELFRDSVNGIVPIDDSAPKWKYNVPPPGHESGESSSSEDSQDAVDNTKEDEGERYVNEEVRSTTQSALLHSCQNSSTEPEVWPK